MFQIPLNEEIFRREETQHLDIEFKKIIDWYSNVDLKEVVNTDLNTKFSRELRNIENSILKLFNAKIIFKFDDASNPRSLSYGMMIFPSMQELKGKIRDAVETNKEGFYLRSCSNVLIVMDLGFLTLCKINKLNERHLTSVLLHELGHKVFVRSQYDVRDKAKNNMISVQMLGILISIPLATVSLVLPFIILTGAYGMLQYFSTKGYVDSEALSDVTAVKYGYGTETYEIMNLFYKLTASKRKSKIKLFKKLFNALNTSMMRRDEIEKALKNELNDSKNTTIEKNLIKSALEEIQKIK